MALVWQYGEQSGFESWKGMSLGMVLLLGGAFCVCTWHFFYNAEYLDCALLLFAFTNQLWEPQRKYKSLQEAVNSLLANILSFLQSIGFINYQNELVLQGYAIRWYTQYNTRVCGLWPLYVVLPLSKVIMVMIRQQYMDVDGCHIMSKTSTA